MMSFPTKAFALSNNKMAMVSVDDSNLQVEYSLLALSEGQQLFGAVLYSSDELGELFQ